METLSSTKVQSKNSSVFVFCPVLPQEPPPPCRGDTTLHFVSCLLWVLQLPRRALSSVTLAAVRRAARGFCRRSPLPMCLMLSSFFD